MSGLLSHSKNSIPVWFRLFWWAEELHALSYALLLLVILKRTVFQYYDSNLITLFYGVMGDVTKSNMSKD